MVRILHQSDGRFTNFFQVERADIGCHADGDALIGTDQHIGVGGGQQCRLLHGGIVVIHHIHSVGIDVLKKLRTDGVQLCFRVTGSGIGHIAGVDLTEVTLGIHKGMQQCLVAPGQTDHGLINRRIAMGIQLHGLADDVGRLGSGTV